MEGNSLICATHPRNHIEYDHLVITVARSFDPFVKYQTCAGRSPGARHSSTSRTTTSGGPTDDGDSASAVGAADGLHRPPVLRERERHPARSRSAPRSRDPRGGVDQSRRLRARSVRDVSRGTQSVGHPPVPRERPARRRGLRRPLPPAGSDAPALGTR